jgi:hypothetical protein
MPLTSVPISKEVTSVSDPMSISDISEMGVADGLRNRDAESLRGLDLLPKP